MKKSLVVKILMLILVFSFLAGCGGGKGTVVGEPSATPDPVVQETDSGEAQYGGELVAYIGGDPMNLDPAILTNYNGMLIISNIGEGLVRYEAGGIGIEPGIAKTWESSEDGLTWTFSLRDNAKFHNGRTVEAADFKYSFERIVNPETMSPKAWIFSNVVGVDEFKAGTAEGISGIEAVDATTLKITLKQPMAPFVSMLASPNLSVVAKEAVEELGDDFGKKVVLAGPFQLSDWNANNEVTLTANEDYWAGRPYLDGVKYRMIGDENTRIVEFDAKQLDITWIPPQHWERYLNDAELSKGIGRADTVHTDFVAVNMEKEPFNGDARIRQAIFYALDMQTIVDYNMGRCAVADGILPSGMLASKPEAASSYNLDKAKELLAEAGYENGVPGTFEFLIPAWPNFIKTCEIYQQSFKQLGINVELKPLEDNAYNEALMNGDYTLAWGYRVAEYPDSDAYYYPLYHSANVGNGGNVARYSNPDVDKLIEAARLSSDEAERVKLYEQINAVIDSELPYIYLTHNQYFDIAQPYVKNYKPSPLDLQCFKDVWLSK
jgi:peptide/nickel transport system substrate-binding protein/oligopeptide transport system substrate-binding protein